MLAMLCRYEGWFLAVVYTICVVVMARRLGYSWRDARGLSLINAVFGLAVPAAGWLLYNFLIFGNPLNWVTGPKSSAAQMAQRHTDLNVGNWPLTVKGLRIRGRFGSRPGRNRRRGHRAGRLHRRRALLGQVMPILGLLTIIPFFVISLELGAEPITLPQQGGLLNYRFGLVVADSGRDTDWLPRRQAPGASYSSGGNRRRDRCGGRDFGACICATSGGACHRSCSGPCGAAVSDRCRRTTWCSTRPDSS